MIKEAAPKIKLSSGKSTEISMQESIDFCTFLHSSQFQRLNDYDVLVTAGENASKRFNDKKLGRSVSKQSRGRLTKNITLGGREKEQSR